MIAEISNERNLPLGTSFVFLGTALGRLVGPILGGYLSHPENFSSLTKHFPILLSVIHSFYTPNASSILSFSPSVFRRSCLCLSLFRCFYSRKKQFPKKKWSLLENAKRKWSVKSAGFCAKDRRTTSILTNNCFFNTTNTRSTLRSSRSETFCSLSLSISSCPLFRLQSTPCSLPCWRTRKCMADSRCPVCRLVWFWWSQAPSRLWRVRIERRRVRRSSVFSVSSKAFNLSKELDDQCSVSGILYVHLSSPVVLQPIQRFSDVRSCDCDVLSSFCDSVDCSQVGFAFLPRYLASALWYSPTCRTKNSEEPSWVCRRQSAVWVVSL